MPSKDLKPYKEIAKSLVPADTAAILDMTCACLKNTKGRPYHYSNDESGLNNFVENAQSYFTYVQSVNSKLDEKEMIIPDVEGLCLWLGICRSTLKSYSDRGGDWLEVIDFFKSAIATCKKNLMLKGKIPAVMGMFDFCNNHQYLNTSEYKMTATVTCSDNKERSYDNIKSYRLPDVVPTEEKPQ